MSFPLRSAFILTLLTALSPIYSTLAYAESDATVGYNLEWHSGRQTFNYVFTGKVIRDGRPSANTRVMVQMTTRGQDLVQETVTLEDGTYELKVALSGNPEQSADWKLIAQAETSSEVAESEGRTILTSSEDAVAVQRPLQFVQG